jgi:hypothetical protein
MRISAYLVLTDDADIPLESLFRFLRTESFTQTSQAEKPACGLPKRYRYQQMIPWREGKTMTLSKKLYAAFGTALVFTLILGVTA